MSYPGMECDGCDKKFVNNNDMSPHLTSYVNKHNILLGSCVGILSHIPPLCWNQTIIHNYQQLILHPVYRVMNTFHVPTYNIHIHIVKLRVSNSSSLSFVCILNFIHHP